jgi:DNA-binding PadR family transcriptional regulator
MIKGSVSLMLLGLLDFSDMYGYQMIQELTSRSGGTFVFKEGTLYPVLYELEKARLIESYWENTENKRKRKYYHITDRGRGKLADKRDDWRSIVRSVDSVLESLKGEVI